MATGPACPKAFRRRSPRRRTEAEICGARSASAPFPQSLGPLSVAALHKGDKEASASDACLGTTPSLPAAVSAQIVLVGTPHSVPGVVAWLRYSTLCPSGAACFQVSQAAAENPVPRAVRRLVKALKPDLVAVELDEVCCRCDRSLLPLQPPGSWWSRAGKPSCEAARPEQSCKLTAMCQSLAVHRAGQNVM